MMKKSLLSLVLLSLTVFLTAQEMTKKAVFATGGTFLGDNNLITIYLQDIESQETIILDQVLGDFTNGVLRDGRYVYAHIGRSAFNPNPIGEETIYKYDLITGEQVDSIIGILGAFKMLIWEDYFIVGKGFGASGSFLEIFDKNALHQGSIFTDTAIPKGIGGMVIFEEQLFVSYSDEDKGLLARFGFTNVPFFDNTFPLDSLSIGLGDLIADDQFIYGLAENYDPVTFELIGAGVTRFTPSNNSFESAKTNAASSGIAVVDGRLIGQFGSDGNAIDINTLTATNETFLPFYAAGKWDRINEVYYLQETDFFSFGKVTVFDQEGNALSSVDTDISGGGIDLVYNHPPTWEEDDLYLFMLTGEFLTVPLPLSMDIDGDMLDYEISMPPLFLNAELEGQELFLMDFGGNDFDDLEIAVTDIWGCSAYLSIFIEMGIIGVSTEKKIINPKKISLFPNPAEDYVQLDLSLLNGEITDIQIFDLQKRLVLKQTVLTASQTPLNISLLSSGTYFILAKSEQEVAAARLLKL